MDCKQFFNSIADKRIALCGIGISNTPLVLNFLKLGARVFACDKRERNLIGELADRLEQAGMAFHKRVYEGYKAIGAKEPERVVCIDGNQTPAEIFSCVLQTLKDKNCL